MKKTYEIMEFDITLGNELERVSASDEHDNAGEDWGDLP